MCMPGCHTFRQLLVKVPHLSAGICSMHSSCVLLLYVCTPILLIVKVLTWCICLYICPLMWDSEVWHVYRVKRSLILHPHACTVEAVHRFYESIRCLFNDDQPSRCDKTEELKKKCKKMGHQRKVISFLLKLMKRVMVTMTASASISSHGSLQVYCIYK